MHRVRRYGRQIWMAVKIVGMTCLGIGLGLLITAAGTVASLLERARNVTPASAIQQEGTLA